MGTNFYLKKIQTAQEHAEMENLLKANELEKLQEAVSNALQKYHIGKRSFGWAFLFQAKEIDRPWDVTSQANVPWDDNMESLKSYVNDTERYQIVNEYGETFTPEQFWNEEVGDALNVDKKHMSHETWNSTHPSERVEDRNETVKNGNRWCNCWFA